jgi:hypothetical protein
LPALAFSPNKDFFVRISILVFNSVLLFGLFGNIAGSAKYHFSAITFQLLTAPRNRLAR